MNGPSRSGDVPATDSTAVVLSDPMVTLEVICHHSPERSAVVRVRRSTTTIRSSGDERIASKPRRRSVDVTHTYASEGERSLAKRNVRGAGAVAHDRAAQAVTRMAESARVTRYGWGRDAPSGILEKPADADVMSDGGACIRSIRSPPVRTPGALFVSLAGSGRGLHLLRP